MEISIASLGAERWPAEAVGAKADRLHRMMAAGFEVPPGFCVTTDAFEGVLATCIPAASTLEELRACLRSVQLPDELRGAIRTEMQRIGARRWAVRSSALEEDDERFSFAGQQRTELDVEGVDGVVGALRRVWADLYELEGLLYRTQMRVDATPQPIAVVVQAMVETRLAGVTFTTDPVDSAEEAASRDEPDLWISASAEGGDAVVEGRGGSHYRVDRETGDLCDGSPGGPLEERDLELLVEQAKEVEAASGRPVDIEWAFGSMSGGGEEDDEQLHLLQVRPVTGRLEETSESVWSNVNVGEALPGVATPLTWSIIGKFSRRGFERAFGTLGLSVPEEYELVGSFRGRVYLNLTQFVSVASRIPVLEPELLFEMAGGGGVDLVEDAARSGSPWEFLLRLPLTAFRILVSQVAMPVAAPLWSRYFESRLERFFERDLGTQNREALVAELDRIDRLFDRTGLLMLTCSSNFLMSYVIMKRSLQWLGGSTARERERELFEALEVRSAEPTLDLLELARRARESDSVRRVVEEYPADEVSERLEDRRGDPTVARFLEAFESFLSEHGHRAPREAELSTPRWREESSFVFEMIRDYLDRNELPSAEGLRTKWERERERVDRIVEDSFDPGARALFRALLGWTRETARMREFMRTHVVESLDLYREWALECGRRLVERGVLPEKEDVFSLRYGELRDWLEGAGRDMESTRTLALRAMVRRALVEQLRELPDPPGTFVLCDGEMVSEEAYRRRDEEVHSGEVEDARTLLRGLPGSRGRVTGTARVVRDAESAAGLEDGEILVAPYTDVGWTPLFVTASAIVMGLGGPLSHACIVAREFGIPTVVNAGDVTESIATGDRITVDGDEGIVVVHEDRQAPATEGSSPRSSAASDE